MHQGSPQESGKPRLCWLDAPSGRAPSACLMESALKPGTAFQCQVNSLWLGVLVGGDWIRRCGSVPLGGTVVLRLPAKGKSFICCSRVPGCGLGFRELITLSTVSEVKKQIPD